MMKFLQFKLNSQTVYLLMAQSFPCTGSVSASLVQQLSNEVLCILRNFAELWAREVWVFVQSVLDAPE